MDLSNRTTTAAKAPRIQLRPIEVGDAARIHEWAGLEEACRYQAWGPNTADETKVFVNEAVAAWNVAPQQRYCWAATIEAGLVVGMGELKIRSKRWHRGEIFSVLVGDSPEMPDQRDHSAENAAGK